MGGKGSGGKRFGAGRRRKSVEEGELSGSRRTRARARQNQDEIKTNNQNQPLITSIRSGSAPSAPLPADSAALLVAPDRLTLAELSEWNWLAPLALKAGRLADMDVPALVDLCQRRVLYRQLLNGAYAAGLEQLSATGALATHPHVAKLTSLAAKIDALMDKFGLTPAGREDKPPEQPADPFDEFDGAAAAAPSAAVN